MRVSSTKPRMCAITFLLASSSCSVSLSTQSNISGVVCILNPFMQNATKNKSCKQCSFILDNRISQRLKKYWESFHIRVMGLLSFGTF